MKKRLVSLILCIVIFAALSFTSSSVSAVNGLSLSEDTISAGDTFTLTIFVPPADSADTASVRVDFDKDIFEVTGWGPEIPGGIPNHGEGFIALSASNALRMIDLSGGLSMTAQLRVKDTAPSGIYSFYLTSASFCYVTDDGWDFEELWVPESTSVEMTVSGTGAAGTDAAEDTSAGTVSGPEISEETQTSSGTLSESPAESVTAAETTSAAAPVSADTTSASGGNNTVTVIIIAASAAAAAGLCFAAVKIIKNKKK